MPLDPDHTVAVLIGRHPWLLQALVDQGFTPLANPAVRQVMASTTTLREAAERHGHDLSGLLAALEAAAPREFKS